MKVRDIHNIEKNYSIAISVFSCKITKMCQKNVSKKFCEEKNAYLLLIEEKRKRHYVLIKDFRKFFFCLYCLQAFSIEEILKRHINI